MAMAMENMSVTLLARFDPVHFLETIDRQRITHVYLVPTMMVCLLKLPDAIKAR
jgi:long-chain acyl-CoA synthetase